MAFRKMNLVLPLSTVVLAASSGYLIWRLEQERVRASSGVEGAAELRARVADLEQERQRLQQELRSTRASNGPPTASADASRESTVAEGVRHGRLLKSLGPVQRMPELAKEHWTTSARMRYGMLLRELGLSEQEMDALLPVLSEIDAAAAKAGGMPLGFGPMGLQGDQELARRRAAVAAVAGEEKADRFERMLKAMPARGELGMIRSQLEAMGDPMTEEQHKKLLGIMSERPPRSPPPMLAVADRHPMSNVWREWRKEANRRLLNEAATVLTARQVQHLAESQALNEAMMSSVNIGSDQGAAGSAP